MTPYTRGLSSHKPSYWKYKGQGNLIPFLNIGNLMLSWTSTYVRFTLCQHKINMEPDVKPIVDHQRRVNPKMKEVIRTEILKLLGCLPGNGARKRS